MSSRAANRAAWSRQETELAVSVRKATSIDEVSPKRTSVNIRLMSLILTNPHRKARASMHCLHLGSQELGFFLAGHESVGQLRICLLCALTLHGPPPALNARTGSQFSPTRYRRSRRSSPSTKSSRRAILLFSRKRSRILAGSRVYREALALVRACEDMHRSSQNTFTTSWPSLRSTGNTQNSMVRERTANLQMARLILDRNF